MPEPFTGPIGHHGAEIKGGKIDSGDVKGKHRGRNGGAPNEKPDHSCGRGRPAAHASLPIFPGPPCEFARLIRGTRSLSSVLHLRAEPRPVTIRSLGLAKEEERRRWLCFYRKTLQNAERSTADLISRRCCWFFAERGRHCLSDRRPPPQVPRGRRAGCPCPHRSDAGASECASQPERATRFRDGIHFLGPNGRFRPQRVINRKRKQTRLLRPGDPAARSIVRVLHGRGQDSGRQAAMSDPGGRGTQGGGG